MKNSSFIEKILFILLFSALALFAACGSSDETEEQPDTDAVTNDSGDSDATDSETTPDNDENTVATSDEETNPDNDASDIEPADNDTDNATVSECIPIEVPTITMSGYPDEVNGYFSPAMGENAIDIVKIYLLGELKEGTYELGTGLNDNYAQCQQCVMVWVDAELATAKEYYFQTAGTLTITKVAGEGDAKRTNGNITGLVLKQAEPNEYMSDFWFIPDGKCITAERIEWETITDDPSTPGND